MTNGQQPVAKTIRDATNVLGILTRAYVPKGTLDYKELISAIEKLNGLVSPQAEPAEPDADMQWMGDVMILQVLADSDQVNDQEREVLERWLSAAPTPQAEPPAEPVTMLTEEDINKATAPYAFHDRFRIVTLIQRAFAAKNGLTIKEE